VGPSSRIDHKAMNPRNLHLEDEATVVEAARVFWASQPP
jgi:hypothetical protein